MFPLLVKAAVPKMTRYGENPTRLKNLNGKYQTFFNNPFQNDTRARH